MRPPTSLPTNLPPATRCRSACQPACRCLPFVSQSANPSANLSPACFRPPPCPLACFRPSVRHPLSARPPPAVCPLRHPLSVRLPACLPACPRPAFLRAICLRPRRSPPPVRPRTTPPPLCPSTPIAPSCSPAQPQTRSGRFAGAGAGAGLNSRTKCESRAVKPPPREGDS